jgi:AhpD family alkylhydroperoxidase
MQARMTQPVIVLPDAMKALLALSKAAQSGTVPAATHTLIHLRVSRVNGCSVCVDMHARELKDAGENDERIWGLVRGGSRRTTTTPNAQHSRSPNA